MLTAQNVRAEPLIEQRAIVLVLGEARITMTTDAAMALGQDLDAMTRRIESEYRDDVPDPDFPGDPGRETRGIIYEEEMSQDECNEIACNMRWEK